MRLYLLTALLATSACFLPLPTDLTPPVETLAVEHYIIEMEIQPKEETVVVDFPTGYNSSFKSYMDYRMITNTASSQWKLQQEAYTDEYGLRKVGEYYCVALGTGISDAIGNKLIITFDTGNQIKAILADQKADIHTDSSNRYIDYGNGKINIVEFVVETESMPDIVRTMGDVSYMPGNLFFGNVIAIEEIVE